MELNDVLGHSALWKDASDNAMNSNQDNTSNVTTSSTEVASEQIATNIPQNVNVIEWNQFSKPLEVQKETQHVQQNVESIPTENSTFKKQVENKAEEAGSQTKQELKEEIKTPEEVSQSEKIQLEKQSQQEKEELKDKVDEKPEAYVALLEDLVDKNNQKDLENLTITKERDFYKKEYEGLLTKYKEEKEDFSKVKISDDLRPLVSSFSKYDKDRSDKEAQYNLVRSVTEILENIWWPSSKEQLENFYSYQRNAITALSAGSSRATSTVEKETTPQQSNLLTWVVRDVNSRRRL